MDNMELMVEGDTLPETYHKGLLLLNRFGEISDCPDWGTSQKECSMTLVVNNPMQEPMISKLFIGGPKELEQYRQEMLDGILDFEIIKGNWEYTYHDRMTNYPCVYNGDLILIDQVQFVIDELRRNPYSRRAVIVIRDVGVDAGNTDPACLQHIQYTIRNNCLNCQVLFRSNDACKATFMNMFALILLQKRLADTLGVEVGTYTHRANSFHCYEKDFDMLSGYATRIHKETLDNLTYDYEGDWKDLMEEEQPRIAQDVKTLKSH